MLAVANSDLEQVSITPATVTAAASTVTVEYTTTTGTMFSPGVMFTFPDVDDNNDGVNDFAGTDIEVTFTPTSGSPAGCTATATETWRVADSGTATQQGAATQLVGRPAGQTQSCTYDVSAVLAVANSDLEQVSITPATVTAAASTVTVEYTTTTGTMFSPAVMFTFPDVDDNNDGVNDFAGTDVEVTFTPTSGSPAGCTATATETWRVADSGTATQQGAAAELVGRPAGQTQSCAYDVTFPGTAASGDLILAPGASVNVSAAAATAAAGYRTEFSPDVNIEVPGVVDGSGNSVFAGTTFTVSIARVAGSHADCTATAEEVWVVGTGGSVARQNTAAVLVDVPAGQSGGCEYNATFPGTAASGDLILASAASVTVSASAAASAGYRTVFSPEVTITVPDLDALSGTTFTVGFARVAGSHAGCTATAEEVWVAGTGGTTARQGGTNAAVLTNVPAGQSSGCEYDVMFPTPVPSAAGDLVLTSSAAVTVRAVSVAAEATYMNTDITFSADVEITVPPVDALSGTTITVGFARVAGSHAGCTATAEEVWVVGTGGTTALQGGADAAASLVDVPAGQSSGCEYDVTFPPSVVGVAGSGRVLALVPAGSVIVSAAAATAAAGYRTEFSPGVNIEVPRVVDGSGDSVFAGTTFTVGYRSCGWFAC